MALMVTGIGSYPRPPREGGEFRLRKTLQALDRGDASDSEVRAAEDGLIREVVQEQITAGVELVTDGQVRWANPVTDVADAVEGFTTSGLIRWFDNNTYFRQPVVKARVARREAFSVEHFLFARDAAGDVPVKAVLPGPYTLAALSVDEHYGDVRPLVADLAAALNAEARDLAAAGCRFIQFDEPALARIPGQPPGELDVLAEVAGSLVDGLTGQTVILATYFGDVFALGPGLFSLPFDAFGLDLVAGPANHEALHEFPSDKVLQAGIVDARNTKVEDTERLLEEIGRLEEAVAIDRLWIAPSCGLEYLPREAAERKLKKLGEVKERLS